MLEEDERMTFRYGKEHYFALIQISVLFVMFTFAIFYEGVDPVTEWGIILVYAIAVVILLLMAILQWIEVGRVLIMDESGCTIRFLKYERKYTWEQLKFSVRRHINSSCGGAVAAN